MLASAPRDSKSAPRIVPALIAMSALQALVACAIFAPGVMAPRIGIAPATLGAYATAARKKQLDDAAAILMRKNSACCDCAAAHPFRANIVMLDWLLVPSRAGGRHA